MQRIDFEQRAVATLRKRVAEVEGINEDLVAFARGHTGVVEAIHRAVLAAMSADDHDSLAMVLTCHWPELLRVDEVAFGWASGERAYRAGSDGVRALEPKLVRRMVAGLPEVTMRAVERGHALFGAGCEHVRSEVLIRLDSVVGTGLILLGSAAGAAAEGRQAARLFGFLGQSVSHMLERWPPR